LGPRLQKKNPGNAPARMEKETEPAHVRIHPKEVLVELIPNLGGKGGTAMEV